MKLAISLTLAIVLACAGCSSTQPRRYYADPRAPAPLFEQPQPEPAHPLANTVAFRALSLVGTPYIYGGEFPQTGFDCSGFTRFIYRDALGVILARTAHAQSTYGRLLRQHKNLRLGDLVFFTDGAAIFHVGLYVGEGRFVHAPRTGKTVQLSSLSSGYWAEHFALARRML